MEITQLAGISLNEPKSELASAVTRKRAVQSTGRDTLVSERAVVVHKRWLSALHSSKSQTCQGLFTATSLSSIPENCKLILPGLTPHTTRSAD